MSRNIYLAIALFIHFLQLPAQQWSISYPGNYPDGRTHFYDGFVDQQGVTFLAGHEGPDNEHPQTLLMRINPDGTHSECHFQEPGCLSKATCVIETLDHRLFVTGNLLSEQGDRLMVLLFDKQLELLEKNYYDTPTDALGLGLCHATLDPHGHVIVATSVSMENEHGGTDERGMLFKFDSQGAVIRQRCLVADYPDPLYFFFDFKLRQLWYHEEDETLLCLAPGYGNIMSFITFDSAFNYIEEHPIWRELEDRSDHTLFRDCYTDHWYSDDQALFFSSLGDAEHNKLRISRVDTNGNFLQYIPFHEHPDTIDDAARHRCMAAANDSTFYFSFHTHTQCYHPGVACVYRLNDKLEVTGRHLDTDHDGYRTWLVFATAEGGCITVNDSCNRGSTATIGYPIIRKLDPDDFEPVPNSVSQATTPFHAFSYPNPVHHYLTLSFQDLPNPPTHYQLFDNSGRKLREQALHSHNKIIDVSGLAPGLYFLHLQDKAHTILVERFIKE